MSTDGAPRPLLIFDGDCGFCRYTVEYSRRLTGDAVDYYPYQEVGFQYPHISEAEFRAAIKYVSANGEISSGAEAAFRILAHAPARGWWLRLYRKLPGFKSLSESGYRLVSKNRSFFYSVFKILYGKQWIPPQHGKLASLFLRCLALVYFAAFVSLGVQITALVGTDGILPLANHWENATAQLGERSFWLLPSIFWWGHADWMLLAVCWGGAGLSIALFFGFWQRLILITLYIFYLSLLTAGQVFMTFQWDTLLLEVGFLAIFFTAGSTVVLWLYRWLVFRFMLLSGAVKLLSNDPVWADFTALNYHYQTQPIPNPLAWYAHQLPEWFQRASVGATFFIELAVPFLMFLPRRMRFAAAWAFLLLQFLIILTGNYNFFNILVVFLCLLLFDDAALEKCIPQKFGAWLETRRARPFTIYWRAPLALSLSIFILFVSGMQLWSRFSKQAYPEQVRPLLHAVAPFYTVNTYGLFAVMTTIRNEIIVEGSHDGENWEVYEFKYKPGDVSRSPPFNIPHQPRLDWQMWFAALGSYQQNPWFVSFCVALLKGSPPVLELLAHNPFPDAPPKFVRARLVEYRFANPEERATSGNWWTTGDESLYIPPVQLRRQ
ncbi:MAG: lipase maturation factor family protein [Gammaproteobacteria bacterium]|nr:lipase maturation factor family protein [Gammaproteobacteria bacterium]